MQGGAPLDPLSALSLTAASSAPAYGQAWHGCLPAPMRGAAPPSNSPQPDETPPRKRNRAVTFSGFRGFGTGAFLVTNPPNPKKPRDLGFSGSGFRTQKSPVTWGFLVRIPGSGFGTPLRGGRRKPLAEQKQVTLLDSSKSGSKKGSRRGSPSPAYSTSPSLSFPRRRSRSSRAR